MKGQGKGGRRAHMISSSVVMDIAAFKVSHSVDSDATTLQAARAKSSFIHWGEHTPPAVLSWILQPSKLATPLE